VAQDTDKWRALVKAVMNIWVLQNARKFSNGCTTGGLSSSAQLHIVSLVNIYTGCTQMATPYLILNT
jgi:hypothetical protein